MSAVLKDDSVLDVWIKRLWSFGVLTMGFLYMAFSAGAAVSMSVLLVEFLTYFRETKFTTSWCGSLALVLNMASAPLWMAALNRSSYRHVTIAGIFLSVVGLFSSAFATSVYHLYVSLGIVAGSGYGALNYLAMLYTSEYFTERKYLAVGIVSTGSAVGNLVIPALWYSFISSYAWRGALIVMATIQCQLAVLSCFMRSIVRRPVHPPLRQEDSTSIEGDASNNNQSTGDGRRRSNATSVSNDGIDLHRSHSSNKEPIFTIENKCMGSDHINSSISSTEKPAAKENAKYLLKNWRFYSLVSSILLFFFAASTFTTFNFDYFLSVGISQSDSVILVLCVGIGNVGGRVTSSIVSQCLKRGRPMILLTAYLLSAVSTGLIARIIHLQLFTALCLLIGASYGLVAAGAVPCLLELFGAQRLREAMSIELLGISVGALIGPPIGGVVFDVTQNYPAVFTVSMAMSLVAATTLLPNVCLRQDTQDD